jgi:hypothetical protein
MGGRGMRELPILFSTEMVRAILDGTKTQTRRVVKVDKPDEWEAENNCRDSEYGANTPCYIRRKVSTEERGIYYPHYDVGDKLYVRETWADNIPGCSNGITYRADHIDPKGDGPANPMNWRPSIHMPKEAARIWLEVTDVRVERLIEITEEDAIKEGVRVGIGGMPYFRCQDAFPALWDSTIKNQDLPLYGWGANPWVWIYEFKRLEVRP